MTEILAKFRGLDGAGRVAERALLVMLAIVGSAWALQLQHLFPFAIFNEQYLGLFLALGLSPVFLVCRASERAPNDRVPWYDWLLTAGALVVGGYVMIFYPIIAYSLGIASWDKVILGGMALILVLEAVRRLAGLALGALLILFERARAHSALPRPAVPIREP
ncbi:MAG: hypothetical protein ACREF4_01270 [Gammaproteobacteria bacterium]